ncbi:MAG: ATP-dependent acyl-CoA ligase, partial [Gammaproteobacteria bacterium]|nr:ATP-dependent acyl-CoA ligase [Gammaproteobacteria bacterium]
MTEASSFCTLNAEGIVGSIGRPFANFQIEILRANGTPAGIKERGEIVLQADPPGLLTPGYLNDPAGSAALRRDGRLYTGDLGYRDASGHFYFSGRKKESIRRRGENISAWEVEQVLNGHPAVKESAVVGVQAAIGEEEILAYVLPNVDRAPDPQDLLEWCVRRLADFQVPRYIRFVSDFERTPSNRIRKSVLSRDPAGAWDVECQRAGHLTSSSSSGEKSGNISATGPFTR